MTITHRVASRLFNRPLLVLPEVAATIATSLADRWGVEPMAGGQTAPAAERAPRAARFKGEPRGPVVETAYGKAMEEYYRLVGSTAVITIEGELVNRGAWVGASSGLTSYEGIQAQLDYAAADPDVASIVLDLETPGGEVLGAFETAQQVRRIARAKPVTALVAGMAASAGYAIASGASRIVTTPSGLSGSIGVVLLHLDRSREVERKGITPTLIFAGAHKVDGNPFAPLPDSVRADLQAEVEQFYAMFTDLVGEHRPALGAAGARATEARTFIGADAVRAGLADAVGTLDDVLADLSSRAPAGRIPSRQPNGVTMSETTGAPAAVTTGITQDEHQRAVNAARAEGEAAGRAAATQRIAAILDHPEAAGREALARHLAFATDLAPEVAGATLAAAPKAVPAAATGGLAARMAQEPDTSLGAPPSATGSAPESDEEKRQRGRLISLRAKGRDAAA